MVQGKTAGLHKFRPSIKLADGKSFVGDYAIGRVEDFLCTEFLVSEVHWIAFNTETGRTTGALLDHVDLGKVDEIGFTDLEPGPGHGALGFTDVAVIRVFAKAVPRD